MAKSKRDVHKQEALRQQGTLNPRPEAVTAALFQANDFFDARDLIQVKYEMLRCVEIDHAPVSHAAREFGFSRPSFYQAQVGFQKSGLSGLLPQKRGPRRAHKLTAEVIEFIQQARAGEPAPPWKELARQVQERFGMSVHPRSIERGLSRGQKKRP